MEHPVDLELQMETHNFTVMFLQYGNLPYMEYFLLKS